MEMTDVVNQHDHYCNIDTGTAGDSKKTTVPTGGCGASHRDQPNPNPNLNPNPNAKDNCKP